VATEGSRGCHMSAATRRDGVRVREGRPLVPGWVPAAPPTPSSIQQTPAWHRGALFIHGGGGMRTSDLRVMSGGVSRTPAGCSFGPWAVAWFHFDWPGQVRTAGCAGSVRVTAT
jgi:hypothetical protein